MYVHIFGYLVNKLEIWWVYLSLIEIVCVPTKNLKDSLCYLSSALEHILNSVLYFIIIKIYIIALESWNSIKLHIITLHGTRYSYEIT